jgi:hypothetical protein
MLGCTQQRHCNDELWCQDDYWEAASFDSLIETYPAYIIYATKIASNTIHRTELGGSLLYIIIFAGIA